MYYTLVTKPIVFKNQNVTKNQVIQAMRGCYTNSCFSTLPYFYDEYNSQEAIDNTNSGNCIGLSLFIKNFLEERHGIHSHLIPASIPKMYQKEGYLPLCHIALAIPFNEDQAYIADPAFYFSEPILFDKRGNEGIIKSSNIYDDSIEDLQYTSVQDKLPTILHEKQKMPKNTPRCECSKIKDPEDKWNYYMREAKDPDKSIGTFYINLQKPFISTTKLDKNNQCRMGYYVKIEGDDVIIKNNGKVVYSGKKTDIPNQVISHTNKALHPYLKEDFRNVIQKPVRNNYYISMRNS